MPVQKFINRLDKSQQKHRTTAFGYAVVKKYGEDHAGRHAALLTYYGFLALFPLLMIATTLAHNMLKDNPRLQETLLKGITDYFPVLGNQLADSIQALHASGLPLLIGLLFALYGARGVAEAFRVGIQKVWGIPETKEGWPTGPLKSVAMVVVGGLGFLLASVISGVAAAAGTGWGFRSLSLAINLFILFWLFTFLLKMCLPRHVSLKETRVGAVTAAIGLVVLQALGTYLLGRHLKNLDALYSYFAVTLGLLFWIYLQAQMLYYSAEIAVVSNKKLWPRGLSE